MTVQKAHQNWNRVESPHLFSGQEIEREPPSGILEARLIAQRERALDEAHIIGLHELRLRINFPHGTHRRATAIGGHASMSGPQGVAVVGATGYAGFELASLLLRHPGIAKPTFYLRESAKPVNRWASTCAMYVRASSSLPIIA